jgi:hypothetical protein
MEKTTRQGLLAIRDDSPYEGCNGQVYEFDPQSPLTAYERAEIAVSFRPRSVSETSLGDLANPDDEA